MSTKKKTKTFTIKELANAADVPYSTVRGYIDNGRVQVPPKTDEGFLANEQQFQSILMEVKKLHKKPALFGAYDRYLVEIRETLAQIESIPESLMEVDENFAAVLDAEKPPRGAAGDLADWCLAHLRDIENPELDELLQGLANARADAIARGGLKNSFNAADAPQIDPEFEAMMIPLSPAEYAELEHSIANQGCQESLKTWRGLLVDGHHRLQICQEHDVRITTEEIPAATREDARAWILRHQLGRRNLADLGTAYYKGKLYLTQRGPQGGNHNSKGHDVRLVDTAKEIAAATGVSARTIRRNAKFAEAVDEIANGDADLRNYLISSAFSANTVLTWAELPEGARQRIGQLLRQLVEDNGELAAEDVARVKKAIKRAAQIGDDSAPMAEIAAKIKRTIDPIQALLATEAVELPRATRELAEALVEALAELSDTNAA